MSKVKNGLVATGAGLMVAAGNSMAALPTEVTTALDGAKTDGVQAAGLVLVVIIAIAAFKFIRKAL